MRIHKPVVASMTCVAVIILASLIAAAGCTASKPPSPTAATTRTAAPAPTMPAPTSTSTPEADPAPDVTLGIPDPGHDEWLLWASGSTSSTVLDLAAQLDLPEAATPNPAYIEDGYAAVAQLGTACIMAFSKLGTAAGTDTWSAAILSRYTPTGLTVVSPAATIDDLRKFIDEYSDTCSPAGDIV